MKTKSLLLWIILFAFLVSCQSETPTEALPTSTPPGQMETKVAATIYANETSTAAAIAANQTSTAAAKLSPFIVARTADAMTAAAQTPIPTSSVKKYNVSAPASACWMNSSVSVRTGQRVIITASGIVNTNKGNEGSNNEPNGQKYICGAIECPLQGVGYGALIGRLDDLKPFFVGPYIEFVATKDGQLYFTVNDWECDDNSGTFELVISIP